MAIANRYRGQSFVATWIGTGGTTVLSGDYTQFDIDRSCDPLDATAGNAADKEYIVGLKDATATLKIYDTAAAGTALAAALVEGSSGTLNWGVQGTATGKPKAAIAAIVKSHKLTEPYDKPVELEVQFQKTGAFVSDYGSTW